MRLVHIVGGRNHGKTQLIVDLVRELRRRGLRVGTIKHSGHEHELDTPGKDSYLHRLAGGDPAAMVTKNLTAVYMPDLPGTNPYRRLSPLFADCDLVLVEGDLEGPGVKVEVWRAEPGTTSESLERDDIAAVVTDDFLETPVPVWPRGDVEALAEGVLKLTGLKRESDSQSR